MLLRALPDPNHPAQLTLHQGLSTDFVIVLFGIVEALELLGAPERARDFLAFLEALNGVFGAEGVVFKLGVTLPTNNHCIIKQCLHAPMQLLKLGIILLAVRTTTLALRILLCQPRVDAERAEGFVALQALLGVVEQAGTNYALHSRQQLLIPLNLLYHRNVPLNLTLTDLESQIHALLVLSVLLPAHFLAFFKLILGTASLVSVCCWLLLVVHNDRNG